MMKRLIGLFEVGSSGSNVELTEMLVNAILDSSRTSSFFCDIAFRIWVTGSSLRTVIFAYITGPFVFLYTGLSPFLNGVSNGEVLYSAGIPAG